MMQNQNIDSEKDDSLNMENIVNPDRCTACTVCMTACPVTAVTRKFRGPKMTGPALSRFRDLVPDDDTMLEYCSNCKLCDLVCPSGVPISTLNMKAKAKYYKTHEHKKVDDMLAHSEDMGKLVSRVPFASIGANIGIFLCKKFGLLKTLGIDNDAPIPMYASKTFINSFKNFKQKQYERKVVFFAGCYINYNQPQVGIDLVKVFQHNKIEVAVDENFVCCGSPMIADGYMEDTLVHAKKNVKLLQNWVDKGYDIVTACTSCGLMLKQEYQELFQLAGMKKCAEHMYDAVEYLSLLNDKGEFNLNFTALKEKYIYHAPCHVRVQARGLPTMELLSLIPEIKIQEAQAGCCGLSGSYGFKAGKREISKKIGKALFEKIKKSNADFGVCECGTCRLQMESGSGIKALHPLTVLCKAYGL